MSRAKTSVKGIGWMKAHRPKSQQILKVAPGIPFSNLIVFIADKALSGISFQFLYVPVSAFDDKLLSISLKAGVLPTNRHPPFCRRCSPMSP